MFDFDNLFKKSRFEAAVVAIFLVVIFLAAYIINLVFGNRSLSQMIELEVTKKILEKRVNEIKKENEKLQKQYFELKELEG